MAQTLGDLLSILDVGLIEGRSFEGPPSGTKSTRAFGGHVVGQALAAAARTVSDGRLPHSLHAYFLRPGASTKPIRYDVETVREGRSFSTRTVSGTQDGNAIFTMTASFHDAEAGLDHQVPASISLPAHPTGTNNHDLARWPDIYSEWSALEFRHATEHISEQGGAPADEPHTARTWARSVERMPDDPVLHRCVLACVSDLTLLSVTLRPHGIPPRHDGFLVASLDHSVWFHRPARVDEWWLYDQFTPSASDGLALATGRIYTSDGALAMSVAQEGLLRSAHPLQQ